MKERGKRALTHIQDKVKEVEERMRRNNAEPEVNIDLGMKNEGRLTVQQHHPRK